MLHHYILARNWLARAKMKDQEIFKKIISANLKRNVPAEKIFRNNVKQLFGN